MTKILKLSVHQLVDFLLRAGDIDNRIFNASTMSEGSLVHARYQAQQNKNYISEYPLKREFTIEETTIQLEGRADGIIKRKKGDYVIDEIKSTVAELKEFRDQNIEWHLGQAKCYALMFAMEQKLGFIGVKMTYIRQGKEKDKLIEEYNFQIEELYQFVMSLLEDYLRFNALVERHIESREKTIKDLTFPFDYYRKGQRELSKYCYATAKNGGRFFVEAPTGIGKTMSTLFPYVKAMGEDSQSKIFYLTAKSSGKQAAFNACEVMKEKGLDINEIVITAKDKICFCKDAACNPDECPFAKAYYSKIQQLLKYTLTNYSTFDEKVITEIAYENEICPFEFQLDLSLFCDVIICDYNYMYDPISYMKRYFDEDSSHFLALVDEAHNLVDRSRDMYSANIKLSSFERAKKSVRHSKLRKMKNQFTKLNKLFDDIELSCVEGVNPIEKLPDEGLKVLDAFLLMCQDVSKNENKEMTPELLDFYLELNRFLRIFELYNERYLLYYEKTENELVIELLCLDASNFLHNISNRIKATTFFSATLSPMNYFVDTLGGLNETDPSLILASPFPKKNFQVLVAPKVSIKYKDREKSYDTVREYIKEFISSKIGNYFVFSPSYEYMNKLLEDFNIEGTDFYVQDKMMSDQDKLTFLDNFKDNPDKTSIGFFVIGGSFSEGIDLIGNRLIGAIVIGVGLPKMNFQSDQIASYYTTQEKPGRDYAYVNPGINKIMQAVGRVIRSETDVGAALLIDDRYLHRNYLTLFENEWSNYKIVYEPKEVSRKLVNFFNK